MAIIMVDGDLVKSIMDKTISSEYRDLIETLMTSPEIERCLMAFNKVIGDIFESDMFVEAFRLSFELHHIQSKDKLVLAYVVEYKMVGFDVFMTDRYSTMTFTCDKTVKRKPFQHKPKLINIPDLLEKMSDAVAHIAYETLTMLTEYASDIDTIKNWHSVSINNIHDGIITTLEFVHSKLDPDGFHDHMFEMLKAGIRCEIGLNMLPTIKFLPQIDPYIHPGEFSVQSNIPQVWIINHEKGIIGDFRCNTPEKRHIIDNVLRRLRQERESKKDA